MVVIICLCLEIISVLSIGWYSWNFVIGFVSVLMEFFGGYICMEVSLVWLVLVYFLKYFFFLKIIVMKDIFMEEVLVWDINGY